MKNALPAGPLQFFQPEPHVGAPTLVAIVQCAVRRAAPNLLRDRVDQRSRLPFSSLAVLNIDGYSVPLNDVSPLVTQRRAANQKPAVYPVSPPQAHFILVLFPSGFSRAPLIQNSWNVF